MKLNDWVKSSGIPAKIRGTFATVKIGRGESYAPGLYELEDWGVSASADDTVFLIAKNPPKFSFKEKFEKFVCEGDTLEIEIEGIEYCAKIHRDNDYRIDDDDCHNPDTEVTGCNPQQQSKLLEARKAWFADEWFYCGIVISARFKGHQFENHAASLWAIEANYPDTDNSYLTEVANELLNEAIPFCETCLACNAVAMLNR